LPEEGASLQPLEAATDSPRAGAARLGLQQGDLPAQGLVSPPTFPEFPA
jgi:hypothetical protein